LGGLLEKYAIATQNLGTILVFEDKKTKKIYAEMVGCRTFRIHTDFKQ
jgi:hypothetical protein